MMVRFLKTDWPHYTGIPDPLHLSHLIYGLNLRWRGTLTERWSWGEEGRTHSLSTIILICSVTVNGDSVAVMFKDTWEDVHLSSLQRHKKETLQECGEGWWPRGRRARSNGWRGGDTVTSPLYAHSLVEVLAVLLRSVWRRVSSQCQDVRGFSVETFRERGERNAEIEACLLTGNPINPHVNIFFSPLNFLLSFKTISESFTIAHKRGKKFRWQPLIDLLTLYGGLEKFNHWMRP